METKKRMSKAQIEKVCNQMMDEFRLIEIEGKQDFEVVCHFRDKLSLVRQYLVNNYAK